MSIFYVCSADHYGESDSTPFTTTPGVTSPGGWIMDNPIMVGDGWASEPSMSCVATAPGLSGTVQMRPAGAYKIAAPSWGARAGDFALLADQVSQYVVRTTAGDTDARSITRQPEACFSLVMPGDSEDVRLIHFAFSISALPPLDKVHGSIVDFKDSSGVVRASLGVTPSGRLQLLDGALLECSQFSISSLPTALLVSSAPVIQPETWYSFSIKITTSSGDTDADVEVYLGAIDPANLVLDGTGLAFTVTASNSIDMLGFLPATPVPNINGPFDNVVRAVRDIVLCNESGDYNTTLLGQCFVSAQEIRAEDEGGGWVANPRQKIDIGILDHVTEQTGLRCADSSSLELGSGDFTFETDIRFHDLPSPPDVMHIMSKWREASGLRSYELFYDGSDGALVWTISTDGATPTEVKRVPWVPLLDHWYHLAVVRSSSEVLFFIDGVQLGVPVPDANTYFDGTAYFGIGCVFTSGGTADPASPFNGWMDETRLTVGVARYTTDFTPPTTRFPRDSDDPFWDSVTFLSGYDANPIVDESGFARTVSLGTPPVTAIFPNDGANSYDVLNERPALDDTYIEGAYTFAQGVFTFEDVPAVDETVTLGSVTYTWKASVATTANQVKIGADIDECIENLIAAINAGAGAGTKYGSSTVVNPDAGAVEFLSPQFIVIAAAIGTAGNSVATTDTMADGFWGAATLEGGLGLPADSDFALERLPNDATGVLGVVVTARAYKTSAGSAQVEFDLVGPGGGVAAGTGIDVDLNPAWEQQVFEEDPDTMASITPSTVNGGRLRVKRTA